MKISVFGLGYVGAVSCGCFAKIGHQVIGVDLDENKINLINSGKAPIVEENLEDYILEGVESKNLVATKDSKFAIDNSDISLICVGTPSQLNGGINLAYIYSVCQEIGDLLKSKTSYHVIAIRSTVIPGTIEECTRLIKEISGRSENDFAVVSNPEFLREGTAISDFWNPPYTIIGSNKEKATELMNKVYADIDAPFYCLKPKESELIKYANNNFHAVKVTFANEIGNICKNLGVDGHVVMDIVSKDTKLNLSSYYMKPGFAFGGSCLPKDVRGLNFKAKQLDLKTPLLSSLLESNEYQVMKGLEMISKIGKKRIGVLGFSFKGGTDDLRESPIVTVIETLIGKGYDLKLYDKNVNLSLLGGKNKEFLTAHIPHIASLLVQELDEAIKDVDIVVIGNKSEEFVGALNRLPQSVNIIDLVRIDKKRVTKDNYEGICW